MTTRAGPPCRTAGTIAFEQQAVSMLRDYGTSVEIACGLTHQDRVIDNPPDSIRPGDKVRIASGS